MCVPRLQEQVVNLFRAAVTITEASPFALDANTQFLRLYGCGFDFDNAFSADPVWGTQEIRAASNIVQWNQPTQGATGLGIVVNATYDTIVYEFTSGQLDDVSGFLSASVCNIVCQITGVGAGFTEVAFAQTTPVVNTVSQDISSNAATITITGLNFDTTVASNVVEFVAANGPGTPQANITAITCVKY